MREQRGAALIHTGAVIQQGNRMLTQPAEKYLPWPVIDLPQRQ